MLDYRACFRTKTHSQSAHAYGYVSGLERMESKRMMANIARQTEMDEQETCDAVEKLDRFEVKLKERGRQKPPSRTQRGSHSSSAE